jgi:hypothetical protein
MTPGAGATAQYLIMINTGRGPARELPGIMTGFTDITGTDVTARLAMTTGTHTTDGVVINLVSIDQPTAAGTGQMAGLALVGNHADMPAWQAVTTRAVASTQYFIVIDSG